MEKVLREHSVKIQLITAVTIILFIWKVAMSISAYEARISSLEASMVSVQATRYRNTDAQKDFEIRDNRIFEMNRDIEKLDAKLGTIEAKIDKLLLKFE